jgi:hypothetical protein
MRDGHHHEEGHLQLTAQHTHGGSTHNAAIVSEKRVSHAHAHAHAVWEGVACVTQGGKSRVKAHHSKHASVKSSQVKSEGHHSKRDTRRRRLGLQEEAEVLKRRDGDRRQQVAPQPRVRVAEELQVRARICVVGVAATDGERDLCSRSGTDTGREQSICTLLLCCCSRANTRAALLTGREQSSAAHAQLASKIVCCAPWLSSATDVTVHSLRRRGSTHRISG